MRITKSDWIAAAAVIVALGAPLAGGQESLPWAFNAPRGEGYSIDLVSVDPVPGTRLTAGNKVAFTVALKYALSKAHHGDIFLVFQDDQNRSAKNGGQTRKGVDAPGGEVTLSDTVTVPRSARELLLFIPLVPDGMTNTTGEVTIRYPISSGK